MNKNDPTQYVLNLVLKEYGELQRARGSLESNVEHLLSGQRELRSGLKGLRKRVTYLYVAVLGAGILPEIPWVSRKVDNAIVSVFQAVSSLLS